jgi:cysteine synthase
MVIECTDQTNDAEVQSFLQTAGAQEINVQEAETGWWIGRYDKADNLYKEEKGY